MNPNLAIGIFGLLGVFARFGLDRAFISLNSEFPVSTFMINILGSFFAGLIYVLGERGTLESGLHLGLLVGFCGGFTTFSAYSLQTLQMIEKGRIYPGILYFALSPALGLAAAFVAVLLSRKFLV